MEKQSRGKEVKQHPLLTNRKDHKCLQSFFFNFLKVHNKPRGFFKGILAGCYLNDEHAPSKNKVYSCTKQFACTFVHVSDKTKTVTPIL